MINIGVLQQKDLTNILILRFFSQATSNTFNSNHKKPQRIVNAKNKDLDPKISKYIIKAAEEIIKENTLNIFRSKFGRQAQEHKLT